jgi:hypothetical protein
LRKRDQEVRLHEQAHLLAAGPYAQGGPRFTYQIGPDGKRYAVGGEVPVDVNAVPGDPQATIQKAATIRRAALAPAHPSGADLAIATKATTMMVQAQQELMEATSEHRTAIYSAVSFSPEISSIQGNTPPESLTPAAFLQGEISPALPAAVALNNYQRAARTALGFTVTV